MGASKESTCCVIKKSGSINKKPSNANLKTDINLYPKEIKIPKTSNECFNGSINS